MFATAAHQSQEGRRAKSLLSQIDDNSSKVTNYLDAATMGRFFPLYLRRSDGKLETLNAHKRKEANQPTAEQFNGAPDASGTSDYYRSVAIDEAKHMDWRRKLGSMLARELGLSDGMLPHP